MNALYTHLSFLKLFALAVIFSFALLFIRILKTDSILYIFLIWNLFLACIPYAITIVLGYSKVHKNNFLFWSGFVIWLVFLPNSPYILTDLQHIRLSTLAPIWFDVLLILSFAVNGLIIGFASLRNIQHILKTRFSATTTSIITYIILLLCGFGIYLGRVLRWNSWDVINNPSAILYDISQRILHPTAYIHTWSFTIGFGSFLILTYYLIHQYQGHKK